MEKGRRKKVKYIQKMPGVTQFSPRGKPGRPDEVELRVDQLEAFKLADYQGYNQAEGARLMGVSRPSFGRILREARAIVANALVNGKIIRIRIGGVQVGVHQKDLPSRFDIPSQKEIQQVIESQVRKKIIKYPAKIIKKRAT